MLVFVFLGAWLITSVAAAATVCNGHSELCNRKYSNITWIGSHDSAFVGTGLADNQRTSVADQLAQGIRFLQAQSHNLAGTIRLCHTSCFLKDAGPLKDYLTTVKTFLDANPNEVVTLLLTNQDGKKVTDFDSVFKAAGIDTYAFAPNKTLALDEWPTLGNLIDSGTRLVVFMDFPSGTGVPYILNEFDPYIFETPFDTTDSAFPQCTVDRPANVTSTGRMGLVNHYLDRDILGISIPDAKAANTTNGAASIMNQVGICNKQHGVNPTFMLLDWISFGDAIAVQNQMNGVASSVATVSVPPSQTNSTSPTPTTLSSAGTPTPTTLSSASTSTPTTLSSGSTSTPNLVNPKSSNSTTTSTNSSVNADTSKTESSSSSSNTSQENPVPTSAAAILKTSFTWAMVIMSGIYLGII